MRATDDRHPDGVISGCPKSSVAAPFETAIHLHRMRPDGSQMEKLPGATVADLYPRWLPAGSGIIFGRCTGRATCEPRITDPNGSNRLLVPAFGNQVLQVMWQPPTP
jgi:hypothetical protein